MYWFRDLLIKLKQATLSFDLCYLPQTAAAGGVIPEELIPRPLQKSIPGGYDEEGSGKPEALQGVTVGADGTILRDTSALKANSLPILTNSSIRGFLNKYYLHPSSKILL